MCTAAIDGWMPRAGAHCLITSRWRNWTGEADEIDVDVFPPQVAVDFLCEASGRTQPEDREQAAHLAKELGCLPLALSHAAAYCRSRKATDFKEYLEKLADRLKQDPDPRSRAGKDYPRSVYATFTLALERVVAGQPELGVPPQPRAEELMGIMAYLGSEDIPLDLFPESQFNRDQLTGILAALDEAALVTQTRLTDGAPAINVHRLVQRVMQVRLAAKASASSLAATAVTLVADAFPGGDDPMDVRSWPRCRLLEPHAVAALAHALDEGDVAEKTAYLLNQYANHLMARADYAEAEPHYRRAIRICEVALGPEHPHVATVLGGLAHLLQTVNRLGEAEPLMHRSLAIDEKSLGPDHPNVAIRLSNLALLLQATNRLAETEPLMRRALSIDEKSVGPDHPKVAIRLNILARLLQDTDRLAEAEPLYCRALAIDEKSYGPDHPNVAICLNNLAGLLRATNRLAEAEPLYRRALAILEASLPEHHPRVQRGRANLRVLLKEIEAVKQ